MAGDWMKIDLELPDKPEVHAIAGMLNIDPNAVVGMLIRVWQWFDKHTTDGNAYGVSYSLADRVSGVIGFGEAMAFVGWLEQNDKTLTMPKFDRHTSASAKTRALTAKRVSNHKVKTNAEANGVSVSDALPREEKRRDKEHTADKPAAFCFKTALLATDARPELVSDWMAVRKTKKASNTQTALKAFLVQVANAGYTINQALEVCCSRSWQGFQAEWVKDIKPASTDAIPFDRTAYEAKRKAEADAAKARIRHEHTQMEAKQA